MTTPAGWYDDGSGTTRYWDGVQWTEHTAHGAQQAPVPAAPVAPAPPPVPVQTTSYPASPQQIAYPGAGEPPAKKSKLWLWILLGVGAIVLIIGGIIAAVVALVLNATSGPRDAYAGLVDAWRAGDCGAEYALLSDATAGGLTESEYCAESDYSWFAELDDWETRVTSTDIVNSDATIIATETYTSDGQEYVEVWQYDFVNVGGEWLLDGVEQVS